MVGPAGSRDREGRAEGTEFVRPFSRAPARVESATCASVGQPNASLYRSSTRSCGLNGMLKMRRILLDLQ